MSWQTGNTAAPQAAAGVTRDLRPGLLVATLMFCLYGGLAVTVDFPRAAMGFQGDEATYYMMGHSLADDGDLTYRREDLVRVWREFPSGPAGLFLKRGRDILDAGLMLRPPFVWTRTQPDPDQTRLFYGKSFAYPLFAAPFVRLFGTNGFLVLNALLLTLAVWCGFLFLHARMNATLSAALSTGFIMASVVPVYFVWIAPELFNFTLGLLAYFCWLYKEVAAPSKAGRGSQWLFRPSSDLVAAVLLGIAAFSKATNALLLLPILAWHIWRRRWGSLAATGLLFGICAIGLFAVNMRIAGEWNYQGGERNTFYWEFPFQTAASAFEVGKEKARNESLADVIFDPRVFWLNLRHNIEYYVAGRFTGVLPYFFPAVFAVVAFLAAPRRRPGWQYLVLAAGAVQMFAFIVVQPYTWAGSGGSVGNRYFLGAYGIYLFLLPPLSRTWVAVIPWAAGALFTAPLVLSPFVTSARPADYAKQGPARLLPVELTQVNDLPINTDASRVLVWFGDNPGFQVYFLDDNAFDRELDKSFWTRGASRAEFLIKFAFDEHAILTPERIAHPLKRLVLSLTAGPVATTVRAAVGGRTQDVALPPGGSQEIAFNLDRGFWYQARAFVWVVSISSSDGFVPIFYGDSKDNRFLGVRVKPVLVE